jgi:hypothetical protein
LIVAISFGVAGVMSNTCTALLWPSASQTSFSSGDTPMPWLGTAVALHLALLVARHFDVLQHLAGLQVADFEAEQIVDVDVDARLRPVDRERADDVRERPDCCTTVCVADPRRSAAAT